MFDASAPEGPANLKALMGAVRVVHEPTTKVCCTHLVRTLPPSVWLFAWLRAFAAVAFIACSCLAAACEASVWEARLFCRGRIAVFPAVAARASFSFVAFPRGTVCRAVTARQALLATLQDIESLVIEHGVRLLVLDSIAMLALKVRCRPPPPRNTCLRTRGRLCAHCSVCARGFWCLRA